MANVYPPAAGVVTPSPSNVPQPAQTGSLQGHMYKTLDSGEKITSIQPQGINLEPGQISSLTDNNLTVGSPLKDLTSNAAGQKSQEILLHHEEPKPQGADEPTSNPDPLTENHSIPAKKTEETEEQIQEETLPEANANTESEQSSQDDEDPLSFVVSEIQIQEQNTEEMPASKTAAQPEAESEEANMEDPLEMIQVNLEPLGKMEDLHLIAEHLEYFAKCRAEVATLPELKETLKTLLPELEVADELRSSIEEIEKNHFEKHGDGWRIEGRRNGIILIFGDPATVRALLKNPELFLSKEDCAILREANRRHQLSCPTQEQEEQIQKLVQEYAAQYMQNLQHRIQKEMAALEQKKQQKTSTKLSDPSHIDRKTGQRKKEETLPQMFRSFPPGFLLKMAVRNQKMLEIAIVQKRREKEKDAKKELIEMDKKYWKTLEDNRKISVKILDEKIREQKKR